ncbi:hypothetical protein BXU06_16140 [Aquaspirillum sp. LM1]|nr:hypothetical protein BXU06_16140 [Aquaspirillum sp. LM1]
MQRKDGYAFVLFIPALKDEAFRTLGKSSEDVWGHAEGHALFLSGVAWRTDANARQPSGGLLQWGSVSGCFLDQLAIKI